MPRSKQKAAENKILNGLFVISESFKRAGISDDDLLDTLHSIDFIHYFDNVKDFRNHDMIHIIDCSYRQKLHLADMHAKLYRSQK